MGEPGLIIQLVIVVAAAAIGGALFEWLRLPAIVGFLVLGAVVGPNGLGLIHEPEQVRLLAELGVAFLLFEIGLELPLTELRRMWRSVAIAGSLQVCITMAAIVVVGLVRGLPIETAIVMGMLVSMSSTALVIRTLRQRAELNTVHGRLCLGILLFQDLCVAPFLLAVPFLAGVSSLGGGAFLFAIGELVVVILVFFAVAKFVLPWILERVVGLRSTELFSLFAFLLAIGSAALSERLGLTMGAGAFIAGLALRASPYGSQLFAEVIPLRGILLGVFFTAIGMLVNLGLASQLSEGIALYVGGVLILKAGVVIAVLSLVLREGLRPSIRSGLALAQTGEFSFVLATSAVAAGLLDDRLEQVFIAGSILTLGATPFLIQVAPKVASWMTLGDGSSTEAADAEPEARAGHVVIVGFGVAGQTLVRILRALGYPYRILDINPRTVTEMRARGEPIEFGDATRSVVLQHLGVERARIVVIATSDPSATVRCARLVRAMAPKVHIIVRTRYLVDLEGLFRAGASEVVAEEFESTIDLYRKVLRQFGIPDEAISNFCEVTRAEGYEFLHGAATMPVDPWLVELLKQSTTEWIPVSLSLPQPYSIAELTARLEMRVELLAIRRKGEVISQPPSSSRIEPGDALLAVGSPDDLSRLRTLLGRSLGQ